MAAAMLLQLMGETQLQALKFGVYRTPHGM
jgi:hypothetical protein